MLVERLTLTDVEPQSTPALVVARLRRLIGGVEGIEETVAGIVSHVRTEGDDAVRQYTRRFDTPGLEPRELLVSPQELDEALEAMPLDVVAGLQVAIANV